MGSLCSQGASLRRARAFAPRGPLSWIAAAGSRRGGWGAALRATNAFATSSARAESPKFGVSVGRKGRPSVVPGPALQSAPRPWHYPGSGSGYAGLGQLLVPQVSSSPHGRGQSQDQPGPALLRYLSMLHVPALHCLHLTIVAEIQGKGRQLKHPPTHARLHAPTQQPTHTPTHPPAHARTTQPPTHPPTHAPTHPCAHASTHARTHTSTHAHACAHILVWCGFVAKVLRCMAALGGETIWLDTGKANCLQRMTFVPLVLAVVRDFQGRVWAKKSCFGPKLGHFCRVPAQLRPGLPSLRQA